MYVSKFEETNPTGSPNFSRHNSSPMSHQSKNNSLLVTPQRGMFRRYSLADTHVSSLRQTNSPYNAHLSTKIDSRSPGYSTRVVQYHEEQEKSLPSYQSKYDKLGIFPIVHFFKKDLPQLKRKSSENKLHVNSAELSKFNTSDQNRMLLEKIIKSSPGNDSISHHKNETNTKSVLDALKEISRKRIHSNEEDFILKDDGKRMHTDLESDSNSRKRLKQASSTENPVGSPSSKYSSINELMASHSSMEGYLVEKTKKDKPKEKTSTPIKTPLQVKKVDVETQTPPAPQPITPPPAPESRKEKKENVIPQREVKQKKRSPVKVFDETPLETMRRNRLTVLMGSLTQNKKPSDKPIETEKGDEKPVEKSLVSILAGSNKSPNKNAKHVTFNIPESNALTGISLENNCVTTTSERSESPKPVHIVTKTSAAIATPIVSASVVESTPPKPVVTAGSDVQPSVTSSISNMPIPQFGIPANVTPTNSFNSPLPSNLFLGNKSPSSQNQSDTTLEAKSALSVTSTSGGLQQPNSTPATISSTLTQNTFMFNTPTNNPTNKLNVSSPVIESSSQKGGFKFELKDTSTSSVPTITSPPFSFKSPVSSFGAAPNKTTTTSIDNSKLFGTSTTNSTPVFGQVAPPTSKTNDKPIFNFTPTVSSSSVQSTTLGFGGTTTKTFTQPLSTFPTNTTSNLSSNFGVPATTSSNAFSKPVTSFETNKFSAPSFMAASTASQSSPYNFGSNTSNTSSNAPVINFSAPTTTPALFDPNSKLNFTNNTTTSSFMFSATNTTSAPATTASSGFNVQSTGPFGGPSMFNKPIAFNNPNQSSAFAATTTSNSTSSILSTPFNTNPPTFGTGDNTSTPSFGAETSKSIFGQNPTPTAPLFGGSTSSSFGTSGFSANNNQSSAFPSAASTTNNVFGNSGAGTFGTSTTTAASTFGSNAPPSFGFGSTNPSSGFGSTSNNESKSTPAFGASSNTGFGTSNTSAFASNPSGFTTTASGFPSSSSFGQSNIFSNNTFGATPSGSTSNTEMNPFGNATANNSNFGGASNTFSANPQPSQSGTVFAFGTNSNPTKPAVFSFGASEAPKPAFNFTPDNSNAFGMNKGFGSSAPSTFTPGATTSPFNVQPVGGGAGMFNIGIGGSSTPTRSRTLHKAKRRT